MRLTRDLQGLLATHRVEERRIQEAAGVCAGTAGAANVRGGTDTGAGGSKTEAVIASVESLVVALVEIDEATNTNYVRVSSHVQYLFRRQLGPGSD